MVSRMASIDAGNINACLSTIGSLVVVNDEKTVKSREKTKTIKLYFPTVSPEAPRAALVKFFVGDPTCRVTLHLSFVQF